VIIGTRNDELVLLDVLVEHELACLGHLIQRFSGVSRRRKLRIFGRTTLEIQFMVIPYRPVVAAL